MTYENVPFNRAPIVGTEITCISEALKSPRLAGGGVFGRKCETYFAETLGAAQSFLTPSCTHSLEMSALILRLQPGDEVIMPSFTFVSTANAFAMFGVQVVFVDIRPDTMNIDETKIEAAITPRTRAIVPVHYGSVACDMDPIMEIAKAHGLFVIEDAAQGVDATYKGRALGGIGNLGTFSFHETKNITSGGEGGLTICRDADLAERAEIIRDKGTNRSQFFRGQVDKYTWVGLGSSYLLNETSAAYLWAQIEARADIRNTRLDMCRRYKEALSPLVESERIKLQNVPDYTEINGHLFYLKVRDLDERTRLLRHLAERNVQATFHYVPLHSSPAGKSFGRFSGTDIFTTRESERLVRLPVFFSMTAAQQEWVITSITEFFS
ncbi:MAG: dTDP-4-amino-4,6-dideoxygalactose transaminase [Tateyamaria sp.]|uniref:dTDP-4-amino-4,6-dideoxygalactose transaminase n=1 Tax=Tateyamaria sp. TaxID=1929288 RepID=UPI00329E9E2D